MMKIDRITFRFILVGIINTLVGATVMFVLYNAFNFSYFIATAANLVVGSLTSYYLNKYFTFESKETSSREFKLFILNLVLCYILAYGIPKWVVVTLYPSYNIKTIDNLIMLPGMILFPIFNYFGQRYFVFK